MTYLPRFAILQTLPFLALLIAACSSSALTTTSNAPADASIDRTATEPTVPVDQRPSIPVDSGRDLGPAILDGPAAATPDSAQSDLLIERDTNTPDLQRPDLLGTGLDAQRDFQNPPDQRPPQPDGPFVPDAPADLGIGQMMPIMVVGDGGPDPDVVRFDYSVPIEWDSGPINPMYLPDGGPYPGFDLIQGDGGPTYFVDASPFYPIDAYGDVGPPLPRLALTIPPRPGIDAGDPFCPGTCIIGQQQCHGSSLVMCSNNFGFTQVIETPCSAACSGGACTGSCVPGEQRCQNGMLEACSAIGSWTASGPCPTCGMLNPGGACPSPGFCKAGKCCESILRTPTVINTNAATVPVSNGPVLKGDFDNDGKIDLVFGRFVSGSLGLLKGRGDGGFEPPRDIPTDGQLSSFNNGAVADLDGDGKADLITNNGQAVATYLGKGNGTFSAPRGHSFDGFVAEIAVGEINGDGRPDLVVLGQDGQSWARGIVWYRGLGDGNFAPGGIVNSGCGPAGFTAADLDGDGRIEILVRYDKQAGGLIEVHRFAGGTVGRIAQLDLPQAPIGLLAAAIDGDAVPDLVISYPAQVHVHLGVAGMPGQFKPASSVTVGNKNAWRQNLAAGDVDGDGLADIVVTSENEGSLQIFRGQGNGVLQFQQSAATEYLSSPTLADLDGDGRQDIIATSRGGNFGNYQVVTFRTALSCL